MLESFIGSERFGEGVFVYEIAIFSGIVGIRIVWVEDAHAAKERTVGAFHIVNVINGSVGRPSGEVGFFANVSDAVAVALPAFEYVGVVNCKPAPVGCVAALIGIGIGCPFVGVKPVEAVAIVHFPHVPGNVEFAKERRVITCFTQVIRKEDFVLGQYIVETIYTMTGQMFACPEAGAAGRANCGIDITLVVSNAFGCESV